MGQVQWQTVSRESIFTRWDFRTKLAMMVTLTGVAFLWESPLLGGGLMLGVLLACLLAGVRWTYLATILKVLMPLYLLLLLGMGFFNVTQVKALTGHATLTPLLTLPSAWPGVGGSSLTLEGTLYGLNLTFKTLTMILVLPLGVFTTDINNMILSLVQLKIPYKIVFIFSSTLRFFPLLFDELQSIIQAQRLRGLALEEMGPVRRARVYATIAVPLILGALSKSQKLEVVLQSKAFSGSSDRTYLHESVMTLADYLAIAGFSLFWLGAFGLYFKWGVGQFAWMLPEI
ncbi:energy-coupling factor transporter transmembrane component T family protein [Lyngbya confervoides]|uniref:Energy-coupling factor transporter transmembrane protein EcfT n=1 Tax=Lyngbya confervoides BDU141951 TaxID=1574623 RepID=A0ABD4T0H6_9CYAN|nr:energy-coupling factor transporter transmembrane component T [Lyngbya confervoides]MCM1981865.1 energy-coupling factor transporter transmembrane protein EcfT [Lyngbya confervoides BDU141951]